MAQQRAPGTLFGHPAGLFVLFFTEMWERFSYYGMRALLVLYMVSYFKWTQEEASGIYKWYTTLVYLTPLLGGFLADRYLGNKRAIIIGAILMAIGHFCMAFERIEIFYAALCFLILGNGMFKPNMSTQVGRLYPQNDPRRDSAYTIFYMGINVGAFLSPLVCGALKDTPGLGFHWGFAAAGVGMVLGLLVYLFGLPLVKEIPAGVVYQPPAGERHQHKHSAAAHVMSEEEAKTTPSVMPRLAELSPTLMACLGVALLIGSPLLGWAGLVKWNNVITLEIAAITSFFAGWILKQLDMAVRDRVLAIYAIFVFVVCFWAAFEQAGNAMNVWADQTTNRYLTETPPAPSIFPDPYVEVTKESFWPTLKNAVSKPFKINPVLTTSFQSINALAIVLLAPIFSWLWVYLARRQVRLSIAMKMAIGVFMQGAAFSLMIWSVRYENQPSRAPLARLAEGVVLQDQGVVHFFDAPDLGREDDKAYESYQSGEQIKKGHTMIAHGGRLSYDQVQHTLHMRGVFNDNHRDRILRATAPKSYVAAVWDLAQQSKKAAADAKAKGQEKFVVEKALMQLPPGFEVRYLNGFKPEEVRFDPERKTLIVGKELADKDYKQVVLAGSDPVFREAMNHLYVQSAKFRVSSWWLVWFYILCTLGELCLSPVGLSMVNKLAPRKYATMLMGIWLLATSFGLFIAGLLGEEWEYFEPAAYFGYIALAMVAASALCYLVARKVTAMMHGVN